jgi:hypothetical protein
MKYRVYFSEWVEKHYYVDIEADSGNSALKIVDSGRHIHLPIFEDTKMEDQRKWEAEEYEEL